MHTLKVMFGGFILLVVCLLLGRSIGGTAATVVATAIKCFLALWLVATLVKCGSASTRPATPSRMRLQLLCSSLQRRRSLPLSFGGVPVLLKLSKLNVCFSVRLAQSGRDFPVHER